MLSMSTPLRLRAVSYKEVKIGSLCKRLAWHLLTISNYNNKNTVQDLVISMLPTYRKHVQLDNIQRHCVLLALDRDYEQLPESELSLQGNNYQEMEVMTN